MTRVRRHSPGSANVIRLSIGLETLDDITADLDQALKRAAEAIE